MPLILRGTDRARTTAPSTPRHDSPDPDPTETYFVDRFLDARYQWAKAIEGRVVSALAEGRDPTWLIDWGSFQSHLASTLTPVLTGQIRAAGAEQLGVDLPRLLMADPSRAKLVEAKAAANRQVANFAYGNVAPPDVPPSNPPTSSTPNPSTFSIEIRMDLVNPYAVQYATSHVLDLAGRVSTQSKESIRETVRRALSGEMDGERAAKQIYEVLGLHPRWANAVRGFEAGLIRGGKFSLDQIDGKVRRYAQELRRKRATMVARTEIMRAANYGRLASWDALGGMGMLDTARSMKEWSTGTPFAEGEGKEYGHKVVGPCPVCAPMDGKRVGLKGKFNLPNFKQLDAPPGHPHCFPAGTVVSGHRVRAATARWMKGDVVRVRLGNGEEFTVTPNHPVLGVGGWVTAGSLQAGDELIGPGKSERMLRSDPENMQMPSRIEDVARSLHMTPGVVPVAVPVATEDFHGDGAASDVSVVWADSGLDVEGDPVLGQHLADMALQGRDPADALVSLSGGYTPLHGVGDASNDGMGGLGVSPVLLGGSCGHGETVSLDLSSDCNVELQEMPAHDVATDLVDPGDVILALAGEVSVTDVAEVEVETFHGWVFNLETISSWYTVSGVAVHNCRCVVLLIPPDADDGG